MYRLLSQRTSWLNFTTGITAQLSEAQHVHGTFYTAYVRWSTCKAPTALKSAHMPKRNKYDKTPEVNLSKQLQNSSTFPVSTVYNPGSFFLRAMTSQCPWHMQTCLTGKTSRDCYMTSRLKVGCALASDRPLSCKTSAARTVSEVLRKRKQLGFSLSTGRGNRKHVLLGYLTFHKSLTL